MAIRLKGSGKDRKYLSKVYGFRDRMKRGGKKGSKRG
jgi:hypothetical protein